jgi:glutamine synthetase
MRILFDGDGYSDEWEIEAARRGLLNLTTSVEAYKYFNHPKNVKLFKDHGVMSEVEINSREEIYFENYAKIVNIEALTMIVMASRDYIPAVERYIAEIADTAEKKEKISIHSLCRSNNISSTSSRRRFLKRNCVNAPQKTKI